MANQSIDPGHTTLYIQTKASIKGHIIGFLENMIITLEALGTFSHSGQPLNWHKQRHINLLDIRRVDNSFPVCYRAAIAYQLQARWELPSHEIVRLLRQYLAQYSQHNQHRVSLTPKLSLWLEFLILESGWLHCILLPQGLRDWLSFLNEGKFLTPHQAAMENLPENGSIGLNPETADQSDCPAELTTTSSWPLIATDLTIRDGDCFPWQCLHARCCSRLKVAQQLGFIRLNTKGSRSCQQGLDPSLIPGLTDSDIMHGGFRNYGSLIHAVIAVLDWPVTSLRHCKPKSLCIDLNTLLRRFEAAEQQRAPGGFLPIGDVDPIQNAAIMLDFWVLRIVQVSLSHTLTAVIGVVAPMQL